MTGQLPGGARRRTADVLVIGGGPAGLATALVACRRQFDVLVVDGGTPPIDKACGEGLMPAGVDWLERFGVHLDPSHVTRFSGIRYIQDDATAEGAFPATPGLGVRRTHLHERLVQRAEQDGVRIAWGVRVTGLRDGGADTTDGPCRARWVVGADGLHSRVRRWAGLERGPGPRRRFGVRRHYAGRPWTDRVEVWWGSGAEAYVTPVGPGRIGVAILWSGGSGGFDSLLARFPVLRERLAGMRRDSEDRGAGPLHQRATRVASDRVALVGDASGFRDALLGEGLALAFHQAEALAGVLVGGDLRSYEHAHRRLGARWDRLARLLLWFQRHPLARRRLVRALARDPVLFSRLLARLTSSRPQRNHRRLEVLNLAWRLTDL